MPQQYILPIGEELAPLEAETLSGPQARDYRKGRVGVQACFHIGDDDELDVRVILAHNGRLSVGISRTIDDMVLNGPTLFAAVMRSGHKVSALDFDGNGWIGNVPRALLADLPLTLQSAEGSEIVDPRA